MKRRWLAGMALTLFGSPACAEQLISLSTSSAGDQVLADRDSITQSPRGEYRRFPAVGIRTVIRVPGGRRSAAHEELAVYSFDCARRTSILLRYVNNLGGTRRQDWVAADLPDNYAPPKPGSHAEFAMIFACSGGQMPVVPAPASPEDEKDGDSEQAP
jgi:hypothetical protein